MKKWKIELERTHVIGERIKKKTRTISVTAETEKNAINEAFELGSCSQVKLFGDTGMCEGEYSLKIIKIEESNEL